MRHLELAVLAHTVLAFAVLTACTAPIKVSRVAHQDVLAPPETPPPAPAEISAGASRTLRRLSLEELWGKYPQLVVRTLELRADLGDRDVTATLAELALHEARRAAAVDPLEASDLYLLAAARAFDYLFAPRSEMERAFDPAFTFVNRIYEEATGAYVLALHASDDSLPEHYREVFETTYRVRVAREPGLADPDDFDQLVPVQGLDVRGFAHHVREAGLGAPLVGVRENTGLGLDRFYPPEGIVRPLTAVLAFDVDELPADDYALFDDFVAREGQRTAVLSFYDPHRTSEVEVRGRRVPLAADLTSHYGLFLALAKLGRLTMAGLLDVERAREHRGVFLLEPYNPDKVPVLMIHGLRSGPQAWSQLTNEIWGDPELRHRYQVWHYLYPTALPYLYSGSILRRDLKEARRSLDPEGDDPAMGGMVVVAHSMGGLLARTLISKSGTALWDGVAKVPPEELVGLPEDVERLRECFVFGPQPFVDRVVFISTPHRGSRMADAFVGRVAAVLATLPDDFKELVQRMAAQNPGLFQPEVEKVFARGGATSIRALSPRHPLLRILAELPIEPGVTVHTIVGNRGKPTGDPLLDSDGIVTLESAHLDEAVSELTVPARHDAYENPMAIREVMRILRQHLREKDGG